MPDYLQKIIYLSEDSYQSLAMNNSIEKNGITLTGIDPNYIYITDDKIKTTDLDENLILPVSHGGTGVSNLTSGALLVGNGENAVTTKSIATSITNNSNTIPNTSAVYNYVNNWTGSSNITTIGTLSSGTVPWARITNVPNYTLVGHLHTEYVQNKAGPNDVNTIYETGVYNITTGQGTHLPKGYGYGQLLTMGYRSHRGGTKPDWASQIYLHSGVATGIASATAPGNVIYFRTSCNTAGTTADWHEWRKVVHAPIDYQKIGSSTKPVYIAEDGTATAITYSIAQDVPSDAVFTDTTYSNGTGLSLDGTTFNHSNSVTAQTTQAVYPIKIDAQGHISAYGSAITPVTSVNGHTGSSVNVTIGDLGLSSALRFMGKATSTLDESTTTAPTISGITNYTPAVGDVVLDSDDEYEYVCIAKNGTTYTWEKLGSSSSYSLSTHVHGNITNDGKMSGSTASGAVTTSHKFLREDGTWQIPAYTTNTDEKLKIVAVTSGTTYYPIVAANSTAAANRQYDATGFSYLGTNGTTSTVGVAKIILGNSTASGTANNKQGSIGLYGSTAYLTTIISGAPTAANTLTLPITTGTIALTSDIPGTVSKTAAGLCPQLPDETTTTKFLRQDGTWVAPPNDNTHYTTKLIAGGSSATAHAAVSSGNVYLRLFDDSTPRNDIQLAAGSNMTITSNANGVITFDSSYTNTDTLMNYTLGATARAYLMGSQNPPTSTTTARAAHGDMGVYLSKTAGQLSAKSFSLNDGAASASSDEMVWMQWNSTDQSLDFIFA